MTTVLAMPARADRQGWAFSPPIPKLVDVQVKVSRTNAIRILFEKCMKVAGADVKIYRVTLTFNRSGKIIQKNLLMSREEVDEYVSDKTCAVTIDERAG